MKQTCTRLLRHEYIVPELFLLLMTSLFTFYHCLLSTIIFCRFRVIGILCTLHLPYLTPYCTLPLILPFVTLHLTLPYILTHILPFVTLYLTLSYLIPYVTFYLTLCLTLPYLTLPYLLPYLTSYLCRESDWNWANSLHPWSVMGCESAMVAALLWTVAGAAHAACFSAACYPLQTVVDISWGLAPCLSLRKRGAGELRSIYLCKKFSQKPNRKCGNGSGAV